MKLLLPFKESSCYCKFTGITSITTGKKNFSKSHKKHFIHCNDAEISK